ncbi:unnamed protein product [Closterium sp. Naga37s-1]|nr:unnamed protein product [Closterium sp. Naga37s-1]
MIAAPMIAASFWAPPVTPSPFSAKSVRHPPHAPRATLSQSCAAPSGLCAAAPQKLPASTSTRNARAREESEIVEHPRDERRREEERKVGERGRGERGREERAGKKRGGNGVAGGDGETNARRRREQRRARERALLKALMAARLGGQATARERAAAAARMVCVGAGDMARAEHLVRLARAAGRAAQPNCRVLTVMARGYCQAGQRRQAYALLQVSHARHCCSPSPFQCPPSSHALPRTMPRPLQEMEQRGPAPDAAVFHVVMEGERHAEAVTALLAAMARCHVPPTERTFRCAPPCRVTVGMLLTACHPFHVMMHWFVLGAAAERFARAVHSISIPSPHRPPLLGSVAMACMGRAGDVAAAEALWRHMTAAHIPPSPFAFCALAHVYGQAGMVDKCADVVQQMERSLGHKRRWEARRTARTVESGALRDTPNWSASAGAVGANRGEGGRMGAGEEIGEVGGMAGGAESGGDDGVGRGSVGIKRRGQGRRLHVAGVGEERDGAGTEGQHSERMAAARGDTHATNRTLLTSAHNILIGAHAGRGDAEAAVAVLRGMMRV